MHLLNRADSALMIIDLQEEFYPIARRDVHRATLARVVDNAAWLAGVASALEIPVIVTEEDPAGNGPTERVILDALEPSAQVLPKTSFGVAGEPRVLEALRATGKETVVLAGAETDVCVGHSALGLQALGFRVVVVSDATFSPGESHDHGERRLAARGIELLAAKGVYYDWLPRLEETRAFRQANPALGHPRHFNL